MTAVRARNPDTKTTVVLSPNDIETIIDAVNDRIGTTRSALDTIDDDPTNNSIRHALRISSVYLDTLNSRLKTLLSADG